MKTDVSPACRKADVIASLLSNVILFVLGLLAGIGFYEITHKSAHDCDERFKDKPVKVVAPKEQVIVPNNFHLMSVPPVEMQVKVGRLVAAVIAKDYFDVVSWSVVGVGWIKPLNVIVGLAANYKPVGKSLILVGLVRHNFFVNDSNRNFVKNSHVNIGSVIVSPDGRHGVLPVGCFKVGYNG